MSFDGNSRTAATFHWLPRGIPSISTPLSHKTTKVEKFKETKRTRKSPHTISLLLRKKKGERIS